MDRSKFVQAMDRRQFINRASASAVVLGAVNTNGFVFPVEAASRSYPYQFIYDKRVRPHNKLIADLSAEAQAVYVFDGDLTPIWREKLAPAWAARRIATKGVTRHAEFFVLATLAREQSHVVLSQIKSREWVSWEFLPVEHISRR